jgi:hypothetical protein
MTGIVPVGLLPWKGAALYLGISVSTLRRLVRAGKIPPLIDVTEGRKAFPYEGDRGVPSAPDRTSPSHLSDPQPKDSSFLVPSPASQRAPRMTWNLPTGGTVSPPCPHRFRGRGAFGSSC